MRGKKIKSLYQFISPSVSKIGLKLHIDIPSCITREN